MRTYLPATLNTLRDLHKAGELGPAPLTGFAVTPALREWYLDDDAEVLEYAAFTEAGRGALHLLAADPSAPRRRVVLSADVPDAAVSMHPELDRAVVRISEPVPLSRFAAIHVDGVDAEPAVASAAGAVFAADLGDDDAQFIVDGAEDYELEWYAVSELPDLLS